MPTETNEELEDIDDEISALEARVARLKSARNEHAAIVVSMKDDDFRSRVTAKHIDEDTLLLMQCKCGKQHFRHGGYVHVMIPFINTGSTGRTEKKVELHDVRVMICVSCKRSFVWWQNQMYDMTDKVDLEAWEKTEKEAHRATGPGGQC